MIDSLPTLLPFFDALTKRGSMLIEHLWDCPKALICALAQKQGKKNILIISGSKPDALLDNFPYLIGEEILTLPPWELLSQEGLITSPDICGRRLETLYKVATQNKPILLHLDAGALIQKTLSPDELIPLCFDWKIGQTVHFDSIANKLIDLGYQRAAVAREKGEFAIRGGIIDLFPVASSDPYRIDFFGDTIDSIRIYDPMGQKTIKKVESLFVCPAAEKPLQDKATSLVSCLEYVGKDTLIILDDPLAIEDKYVSLKSMQKIPSKLAFPLEEFLQKLPFYPHVFFLNHRAEELSSLELEKRTGRDFYSGKNPFQPLTFEVYGTPIKSCRYQPPFEEVGSFLCRFENTESATFEEKLFGLTAHKKEIRKLEFIVRSPSEKSLIEERINALDIDLPANTEFKEGYLSSGLALPSEGYVCLPTAELTQRRKVRRQKWRSSYSAEPTEYLQLTAGDIVVHFHHGIGKFIGIESLPNHEGEPTEFLQLEYADKGKLYVPMNQSHLVNKYVGAKEDSVSYSALGSSKWNKTCVKAQNSIMGYAEDLLKRAAERAIEPGFSFGKDSLEMQMFEEDFAFVESEDQLSAIADIKKDMMSKEAMDRLVCGDVGYGKTEVAMRAAFKAVADGKKQVAVLVPTTVLALQHYETFVSRMANFPITIEVLSRGKKPKEAKEILKRAQEGKVDILIGTHRLISKDVAFKNLGLLIIDEEQRFGVRAKEHLKALKCGVDCLTLSATPIPRTLYMSLIGIKEVSVISTPPQDRLPIQSVIAEKHSDLIQKALLREFSRGGQAFFIHNRIDSLPKVELELSKLVPEAKILTGHGRMDAEEMDAIFHSFKQGTGDLLLSTTIVENGIDIPNANTIFIDRADQFGMADLYQLRGRVGRWNKPAYAYFMVNSLRTLPEIASKRLKALAGASGHGGGLKIAMRDLEIRGAGDILGKQQSGQVSSIGFHLYCKLLKKAIAAYKKKTPLSFMETKVEYPFDAKIPESYIQESQIRMELYYRLGNLSHADETYEIVSEMEDRFGVVPEQVTLLCLLTRLRLKATELNIASMKFTSYVVRLEKCKGKKTQSEVIRIPKIQDQDTFEKALVIIIQNFGSK